MWGRVCDNGDEVLEEVGEEEMLQEGDCVCSLVSEQSTFRRILAD